MANKRGLGRTKPNATVGIAHLPAASILEKEFRIAEIVKNVQNLLRAN